MEYVKSIEEAKSFFLNNSKDSILCSFGNIEQECHSFEEATIFFSGCPWKEGYLVIWDESGDELHANLIDEENYEKIVDLDSADCINELYLEHIDDDKYDPWLHSWFSQTGCVEPWPYNNTKILGTKHIIMC